MASSDSDEQNKQLKERNNERRRKFKEFDEKFAIELKNPDNKEIMDGKQILLALAKEAGDKYTTSRNENKHIMAKCLPGTGWFTPVDLEYLSRYIPGAEELRFASDYGSVYSILELQIDGKKYYGIWDDTVGCCSCCDKNQKLQEDIEKLAVKNLDDAITALANNLMEKIRSGHIFMTFNGLVNYIKNNINILYTKLYKEDPSDKNSEIIKKLIDNDVPLTLRDILTAISVNISTDEAKELGTNIIRALPSRHRRKVNVIRDGVQMAVTVYQPDEFITIERTIQQWLILKN